MTDFSTDEQVDVLFKNYIGVPTTRKDREWYQESYLATDPSNSLTSGHGLNHNNITLNENIWSQTIDASFVPTDVSVNLTDYVAGTYDVSAVFRNADGDAAAKVLRIEKLKLERVESGNDQAWYCLGDNSVNVLEDIIPFNFRETALSIPYAYILYNGVGVSNEMPYGESGGNWMIDHRTGVVYIPDVENVTLDDNGLYLTFYKYVGGKGVGIEYDRNNNLTVQPSGGFISFGDGNITTNTGYPNYQTLGTEYIVNPPSVSNTVYGVNITAMNKRTRASYASAEACVNTWTSRTSAADNSWQSVCWSPELSLFVAVAKTGTNRVMTSSDGITWTSRSVPDGEWFSVCWSPELSLFVAVAIFGTNLVMTSTDGSTWEQEAAAADNIWQSVCWSPELSLFVAVGQSGTHRVMISSDGINWVSKTAAANNSWFSVCWSPDLALFVAVAISGTNRVMTSPDGNTWTSILVPDGEWYSVCWSPELSLFVAVGYNSDSNVSKRVITSSDGISWTSRTAASNDNWQSVCWSPELSLFVAVGQIGTNNRVMTSPDGINWTSRTPAANNAWSSICWSPELSIFVAVSFNGTNNRVMTSSIGMPNSKSVVKALPSQMMVLPNGNVGIGTTSPTAKLDIVGDTNALSIRNGDTASMSLGKSQILLSYNGTSGYTHNIRTRHSGVASDNAIDFYVWTPADSTNARGSTNIMSVTGTGVEVNGSFNSSSIVTDHLNATGGQLTYSGYTASLDYNYYFGAVLSYYDHGNRTNYYSGIASTNHTKVENVNVNVSIIQAYKVIFFSDKRIKKDIEDVPDHEALQKVRDIPCRYYNYRDNVKNDNATKTIGFIAQEVEEVFPEAIAKHKEIIPNLGLFLTDELNTNLFSWNFDSSNNKWKLTIPTINDLIIDSSDNVYEKCKVKFIVNSVNLNDYDKEIADLSGDIIEINKKKNEMKSTEKELILEIENDLQSFIFDKKWNTVFLYGIEIRDLCTVDKNKLFALNFSATQEIDRQQQADKVKIATLETEIEGLKSELSAIKAHLGL